MKNILHVLLILLSFDVFGQENPSDKQPKEKQENDSTRKIVSHPYFKECKSSNSSVQVKCTKTRIRNLIIKNLVLPDEAYQLNVSATAYVKFIVDSTGSVSDVNLVKSSGYAIIDEVAIATVKKLPDFIPGQDGNGNKIPVKFVVPVKIVIDGDEDESSNDSKDSLSLKGRYSNTSVGGTMSISTGLWMPDNSLQIIGNHPFIGVQFGYVLKKRIHIDYLIESRFLYAPQKYNYRYEGQEETGRFYFGSYYGLEFDYSLFLKRNFAFQTILGVGYDRFDFKFPEIGNIFQMDGNFKGAAHSPNFNFGFLFKKRFKEILAISFYSRYNIVDYTLGNKINYEGNALVVGVRFGIW